MNYLVYNRENTNFNYINQEDTSTSFFSIEGKTLRLNPSPENVKTAEFWAEIEKVDKVSKWETLSLNGVDEIRREKIHLLLQSKLYLHPSELKNSLKIRDPSRIDQLLIKWEHFLSFYQEDLIDVNATNGKGMPLLHIAILTKNEPLLELLFSNKDLDLFAKDKKGMSPLHIAVATDNRGLIAELIRKGADVNAKTPSLITPLHIACSLSSFPVVELLLKAGADLTAQDYENKTPLHLALWAPPGDFSQLTLYLLRAGEKSSTLSSEIAYRAFKQTKEKWLKEISLKVDPLAKSEWKERLKKKLCAHVFSLEGYSPQITRNEKNEKLNVDSLVLCPLEGMDGYLWVQKQGLKHLAAIRKLNAPEITNASLDLLYSTFEATLSDFSALNKEILARFLEGKPVVISTGFRGHATKFIFWKDFLLICNLGTGSHTQIEIFRIKKENLTLELIAKCLSIYSKPFKEYQQLREELIKKLSGKKEEFERSFERFCQAKIQMQEIGNCTFASFQAAEWALLILHAAFDQSLTNWKAKGEKKHQEFEFLVLFTKIASLESYIDFHLSTKSLHYPDVGFVNEMMKKFPSISEMPNSLKDKFQKLKLKLREFRNTFKLKEVGRLPSFHPKSDALRLSKGLEPTYYTLDTEYMEQKKA